MTTEDNDPFPESPTGSIRLPMATVLDALTGLGKAADALTRSAEVGAQVVAGLATLQAEVRGMREAAEIAHRKEPAYQWCLTWACSKSGYRLILLLLASGLMGAGGATLGERALAAAGIRYVLPSSAPPAP